MGRAIDRYRAVLDIDPSSQDAILALDVRDCEKATAKLDSTTRELNSYLSEDCLWMDVGFHETGLKSWSLDYGRYLPKSLSALGDPRLAMPQMTDIATRLIAADPNLPGRIAARWRPGSPIFESRRAG